MNRKANRAFIFKCNNFNIENQFLFNMICTNNIRHYNKIKCVPIKKNKN